MASAAAAWLSRATAGHTGRTPSTSITWYRVFFLEVEQVCRALGYFPVAEGDGGGGATAAGGAAAAPPASARPGALVQPALLRALEGHLRSRRAQQALPFLLPCIAVAIRLRLLGPLAACVALALAGALALGALRRYGCCICMEDVPALETLRNPGCGGCACRGCVALYLASDLAGTLGRVRRARAWNVRCFCGCGGGLDEGLALVGTTSGELRELILNLMQRRRYIARCPEGVRVADCPHTDCVGVGYSGQPTIMCFVCERSWDDPHHNIISSAWNWVKGMLTPAVRLGAGWRPCPHCGSAIEKNGGCRNMRCSYCDRVFLWGLSRNSAEGADEGLAPPSTGGARARASGQ